MDSVFMDVDEEATDVVSAIQRMHRNVSYIEEFKFISRDGQQEFSSHILILAIHSSVLQDMIYGPSSCKSIKIEDVDNLAIENLIRHCYAEDLVFMSVYDVTETKTLADKFQIFELSRICVTRFASIEVNLSNVLFVLKTSVEFENATKESECLLLIKENKDKVFASESFLSIVFVNVLEIFVKLREKSFLTEFEFLHFGIGWLETNSRKKEGKEQLLNQINISRISLNDYLDIIVSYPEFFSNTEVSSAVNLIRSNSGYNGHQQDAETSTDEIEPIRSNEPSVDNEELGNQQEVPEIKFPVDRIKSEETVTEANEIPLRFTEALGAKVKELERCTQVILEKVSGCSQERVEILKNLGLLQHEGMCVRMKLQDLVCIIKEILESLRGIRIVAEGAISEKWREILLKVVDEITKSSLSVLDYVDDISECIGNMAGGEEKIRQLSISEFEGCPEGISKCLEDVTEILQYFKHYSSDKVQDSGNLIQLTIQMLREADGANAYQWSERAKVIVKDGISTRSLQFAICDQLKKGLIGFINEDVYRINDVDISYEGVFYMMRSLQDPNRILSPLQYLEALKAAKVFQLTELSDKLILTIGNIVEYDPAFLEGLNSFSYFKERCLYLLTLKPLEVVLHPNYINCGSELIILLLKQPELRIVNESQLLFLCIMWLEARNRQRLHFRSSLLIRIAFENISTIDFKYGIKTYPDFFTDSEKESVLAYKEADGDENIRIAREKLPDWYSFKNRTILPKV